MADNLPEPKSRKEEFLAKAAGMDGVTLPEPASREEEYLNAIAEGGGGGGGTTYTAGDGIDITNDTISVDTDTIQEKLTAGTGIDITDNTISATGGGGDTVYSTKNTSNSNDGGAVYIGGKNASQIIYQDPTTTDNHRRYFWALPFNTSETANTCIPGSDSINIGGAQSNNSEHNVTIGYRSISNGDHNVNIGYQSGSDKAYGSCVCVGESAQCLQNYSVALGRGAQVDQGHTGAIALGAYSQTTRGGEVYVGTTASYAGYNSTNYRVIGGVHDGQLANDAVTVGQINALIDAINTATNSNISHIGS